LELDVWDGDDVVRSGTEVPCGDEGGRAAHGRYRSSAAACESARSGGGSAHGRLERIGGVGHRAADFSQSIDLPTRLTYS